MIRRLRRRQHNKPAYEVQELYLLLFELVGNVFGIHSHVPNVNKENCILTIIFRISKCLALNCAPHSYEEGHGEVGNEAVVDAEGYVALANRLGDDWEGSVHCGGAAG